MQYQKLKDNMSHMIDPEIFKLRLEAHIQMNKILNKLSDQSDKDFIMKLFDKAWDFGIPPVNPSLDVIRAQMVNRIKGLPSSNDGIACGPNGCT